MIYEANIYKVAQTYLTVFNIMQTAQLKEEEEEKGF